jgi:hypothetical protein
MGSAARAAQLGPAGLVVLIKPKNLLLGAFAGGTWGSALLRGWPTTLPTILHHT